MFKFYFLAVTYVITILIIGVYLRKQFVSGDFIGYKIKFPKKGNYYKFFFCNQSNKI